MVVACQLYRICAYLIWPISTDFLSVDECRRLIHGTGTYPEELIFDLLSSFAGIKYKDATHPILIIKDLLL